MLQTPCRSYVWKTVIKIVVLASNSLPRKTYHIAKILVFKMNFQIYSFRFKHELFLNIVSKVVLQKYSLIIKILI